MIMANVTKEMRRNQARYGKQNIQHVFNSLLWKIVSNNGGKINIACSELKKVPPQAALKAKYDQATDTMVIVSIIRNDLKSNIIVPDNGIIT
jgi:hypothetical protein